MMCIYMMRTAIYNLLILHLNAFVVESPPMMTKQPPAGELFFHVGKCDNEKNRQVLLECEAEGQPTPKYSWKKNGEEFNWEADDFRMRQNNGTGTLIITVPKEQDEGLYQCFATNELGTATSNIVHVRKAELDDSWGRSSDTLIGLLIIVGALILFSITGVFFWRRKKTAHHNRLTEEQLRKFRDGSLSHRFIDKLNNGASALPYDMKFEISKSDVKIDKNNILGIGKFAVVFEAKWITGGQQVALKTNKCHESNYLEMIMSEIKTMILLGHHSNIVSILGAYTAEIKTGKVYILTDLCDNGSLEKYLRKLNVSVRTSAENNRKPEFKHNELMTKWSFQIACGMEYIASKHVVHADLATRNVLLDTNLIAKITDFGLSCRLYEYTRYTKTTKSPLPWRWMAPESMCTLQFSTKSDVWSFGVTLWEIFTFGSVPYPGLSWSFDFVDSVKKGLRLPQPQQCTHHLLYAKLLDCWDIDPLVRPDFADLKQFLRDILEETSDVYDICT